MVPLTHLVVGYLFSKTYCEMLGIPCGSEQAFTAVTIISSVFPDIDIFFGKKINEHRNTIFHAPIFWISFTTILIIYCFFNNSFLPYSVALGFGVFSHIFLDWFSGRTIGIRLFYPFSKKMYSLFPLNPAMGNVSFLPNKNDQEKYLKFLGNYFNNPFLALAEVGIYIIFLLTIVSRALQ